MIKIILRMLLFLFLFLDMTTFVANCIGGDLSAGEQKSIDIGNNVKIDFVWVPAGTFLMGTPLNDPDRFEKEVVRKVTLTKGFWLGKYEVTQEQWQTIMMEDVPAASKKGNNYPVENVSWEDVTNTFLPALNAKKLSQGALRLPTDAEWEYACRSGSDTTNYWGNNLNDDYCWHPDNSEYSVHSVGQKKPNAWGLYDMNGNVSEWCADWDDNLYTSAPTTDPVGNCIGPKRINRGGGYLIDKLLCRSTFQCYELASTRRYGLGFRLVMSSE